MSDAVPLPSVLVLQKNQNGGLQMIKINLRDYYPFYFHDSFIEVEDKIVAALNAFDLLEDAYQKRTYRHKAYYSLDRNDGIERDIVLVLLSPPEIYEREITNQELYTALNNLSDKQAKRIYAYYFLGMSKYAIARTECVDGSSVRKSIEAGLKRMEKVLRNL
jgi:RNA polymerase sigma-70 factor (ECF subfamily)